MDVLIIKLIKIIFVLKEFSFFIDIDIQQIVSLTKKYMTKYLNSEFSQQHIYLS